MKHLNFVLILSILMQAFSCASVREEEKKEEGYWQSSHTKYEGFGFDRYR